MGSGTPQTDVDLERGDYGFDFNPVARLASASSTSAARTCASTPTPARSSTPTPVTAGVQIDGPLVFATSDANNGRTPHVVGAAYTSNVAGATTTILYDIDTTLDVLVTQGTANGTVSPNTGQLFTVGPLGVNASDVLGFDIVTDGPTDTAYAAMRVSGQPGLGLYTINLATGAATLIGRIGTANIPLVGMTVACRDNADAAAAEQPVARVAWSKLRCSLRGSRLRVDMARSGTRPCRRAPAAGRIPAMKCYEVIRQAVDEPGVKAVAAALKVSPALVYKWCEPPAEEDDPDQSGARNPLDRVREMYHLTKDIRLVRWLCNEAGGFFVANPVHEPGKTLDEAIFAETRGMVRDFSELLDTITESVENDARHRPRRGRRDPPEVGRPQEPRRAVRDRVREGALSRAL